MESSTPIERMDPKNVMQKSECGLTRKTPFTMTKMTSRDFGALYGHIELACRHISPVESSPLGCLSSTPCSLQLHSSHQRAIVRSIACAPLLATLSLTACTKGITRFMYLPSDLSLAISVEMTLLSGKVFCFCGKEEQQRIPWFNF